MAVSVSTRIELRRQLPELYTETQTYSPWYHSKKDKQCTQIPPPIIGTKLQKQFLSKSLAKPEKLKNIKRMGRKNQLNKHSDGDEPKKKTFSWSHTQETLNVFLMQRVNLKRHECLSLCKKILPIQARIQDFVQWAQWSFDPRGLWA